MTTWFHPILIRVRPRLVFLGETESIEPSPFRSGYHDFTSFNFPRRVKMLFWTRREAAKLHPTRKYRPSYKFCQPLFAVVLPSRITTTTPIASQTLCACQSHPHKHARTLNAPPPTSPLRPPLRSPPQHQEIGRAATGSFQVEVRQE